MKEHLRCAILLGVLAGGFLTTAIEVRYLHRSVLGEEWQAIIPVVFCAVATVACVLAIAPSKVVRSVSAVVMLVGVVTGSYGVIVHSEGEAAAFQRLFIASIAARADDDDDEHGRESEEEPPVLAPLGIAGLSMIGLLVLLPGPREQRPG